MSATLTAPDSIRRRFAAAMSAMYQREVPAYGALLEIVSDINRQTLSSRPALADELRRSDNLARLDEERHGAIRLGGAAELAVMRRVFAVMGMFPVGYYDLSAAGIPVHSTAFRPLSAAALARSPFRVFTSILRLELIENKQLRREAAAILGKRQIFTPAAIDLLALAEAQGGLNNTQANIFIQEILTTFRWHSDATVTLPFYQRLHKQHQLIADIVSFKGPHINHLTPRTLDIDAVQQEMPRRGIHPKAVIEGPPPRRCPILLRQTSFRALTENITFSDRQDGRHTARFGEVEQRGVALTPAGRRLYDQQLQQARTACRPAADGSNAEDHKAALADAFSAFPDNWRALLEQQLAYFIFTPVADGNPAAVKVHSAATAHSLIDAGLVAYTPITYEDFLPVSAAGIFQSNLADNAADTTLAAASRRQFETALEEKITDECTVYEKIQADSLAHCIKQLQN